jgi:dTDP-L-rhamnose 4-epimerase
MATKILITGGAGFIGSNLSLSLLAKGFRVTVLDNLSEQIHGPGGQSELYLSIKDKVNFIRADIRNKEMVTQAVKGAEVIVHLAAETGTGQSMYETERYIDVNCRGTAVLLDALLNEKHSVKKVVLASSRAVYGEGKYQTEQGKIIYPEARNEKLLAVGNFEPEGPSGEKISVLSTDEESRINPFSIYAATKYNQEQYISIACRAADIPFVIFRYQNVYGPGQSLKNPYTGILSIFSTQIKNGNAINIFEDGFESRDFVYIDDVVAATVLGIESDAANNGIINVGTGTPVTVLNVAQKLADLYKATPEIKITGQYRVGDIRHNFGDITRLKKILGFTPEIDFETGISRFTDWVNGQQIESDNYDRSIAELKSKGLFK